MKNKLHTADHILSSILEKKFNTTTKAMQFSEDSCRCVYDCEVDLRPLQEDLEQEVNEIISEGYDVISYSLPREEAAKIADLSLVPESFKDVDIYEIVGFNKLACIGPHVKNTKDIGKFKILGIKKKGATVYSVKYTVS